MRLRVCILPAGNPTAISSEIAFSSFIWLLVDFKYLRMGNGLLEYDDHTTCSSYFGHKASYGMSQSYNNGKGLWIQIGNDRTYLLTSFEDYLPDFVTFYPPTHTHTLLCYSPSQWAQTDLCLSLVCICICLCVCFLACILTLLMTVSLSPSQQTVCFCLHFSTSHPHPIYRLRANVLHQITRSIYSKAFEA